MRSRVELGPGRDQVCRCRLTSTLMKSPVTIKDKRIAVARDTYILKVRPVIGRTIGRRAHARTEQWKSCAVQPV
jgi:hypothetical protein